MADARVLSLVDRQGAARARVESRVLALLARILRGFTGWYDDAQVASAAGQAATVVRAGQDATATLTGAYLRQVLLDLGAGQQPRTRVRIPADLRAGVTVEQEFDRVAKTYRRLRVDGLDELVAQDRAIERAQVIASTDLALAARGASRLALVDAGPAVLGYRRVIRPELSAGGTCGLCIAASDRVYQVGELLPIHARCNCLTLPVVEYRGRRLDPGESVNAQDLADLYRRAGSTAAADLKRVRVVVEQHGEQGPVLVVADQHFRGPAQVAADLGQPAAA